MSGIDTQILKSEEIDLSGEDIHRITDGKCKIMAYEDLQKYQTLDELMTPNNSVIILYQTKADYGHWVSLLRYNNSIEFFDPYGFYIDEELKIIDHLHLRSDGITQSPHLTDLINKSNYKIIYNNKKLQKRSEHTNTCGRWVSLRVRFGDISLDKFISLMTKNKHYDGDFWVSALSLLI